MNTDALLLAAIAVLLGWCLILVSHQREEELHRQHALQLLFVDGGTPP